jgi:hypothetical protein
MLNKQELNRLARFSGFAKLTILSSGFLPVDETEDTEIISKVQDLTSNKLPLKARWKSISMHINLPKVRQRLPEGYTDQDLAEIVDDIIKNELKAQASKNFSEVDTFDLLRKDFAPILCLAIVAKIIVDFKYGKFSDLDGVYIVIISTLIKILFSNIDTLMHYLGTEYGARWTALEGVQSQRKLLIPFQFETGRLITLSPKTPR